MQQGWQHPHLALICTSVPDGRISLNSFVSACDTRERRKNWQGTSSIYYQ